MRLIGCRRASLPAKKKGRGEERIMTGGVRCPRLYIFSPEDDTHSTLCVEWV